jgi:UDP-N-acetylglucosamine 4-epimerase
VRPVHREPRRGDVRFSQADISKARKLLGFRPTHRVLEGLEKTVEWYAANLAAAEPQKEVAHA